MPRVRVAKGILIIILSTRRSGFPFSQDRNVKMTAGLKNGLRALAFYAFPPNVCGERGGII